MPKAFCRAILHRRSSTSFWTQDIAGVAYWLRQYGYCASPPHTHLEYVRLRHGASLVVLYCSGLVLVQGRDVEMALALLGRLEREVQE